MRRPRENSPPPANTARHRSVRSSCFTRRSRPARPCLSGRSETSAQPPSSQSVMSKANKWSARQTADNSWTGQSTTDELIIYESNFLANTVHAFSSTGTDLGVFCSVANPTGLAFDQAGNLFVASDSAPDFSILKFAPDGSGTVFATSGLDAPHALAFDEDGNLYVANAQDNTIENLPRMEQGPFLRMPVRACSIPWTCFSTPRAPFSSRISKAVRP